MILESHKSFHVQYLFAQGVATARRRPTLKLVLQKVTQAFVHAWFIFIGNKADMASWLFA